MAQQPPPILLPHPGQCPNRPVLHLYIFDNSGSVIGSNDVIGDRYEEASLALAHVGRRCTCGRELVAILPFDRGTSGDVGPVPLDHRGRARIEHGLAPPPEVVCGISELGPSLQDAYRLTKEHPSHDSVLVIFSDFELFDHSLEQVYDDLIAFPGQVHAVVLRAQPPARLADDERITVTRLSWDSPPGSVANAVFGALTAMRRTL
ncbi:MAG: hypothetical protein ACRD0K_14440 [Egibacteraceae bacterium]